MGIYFRIAAALLVVASFSANSAVRTTVKPSAKSVIGDARTGAVSTPNGEISFYGPDKVYELRFNPGDSPGPTIRPQPESTIGKPQFPYGGGAALPNEKVPATKVAVKPSVKVPKKRIFTRFKDVLKANPASIALQAATAGALAAVGWVMDEGTKVVKKPVEGTQYVDPKIAGWCFGTQGYGCTSPNATSDTRAGTPMGAASKGLSEFQNHQSHPVWQTATIEELWCNESTCGMQYVASGRQAFWTFTVFRYGKCDNWDSTTKGCLSTSPQFEPVTATDMATLDPWLNAQGAEWVAGLLRDVCNASNNPAACFEEMKSGAGLQGPASVQGPSSKRTVAYLRPDGTTGTRTTDTSTRFDLSYGDDYFDVNTKTTSKTTEDGQVTSEETTEDTTPVPQTPEQPSEEPDDQEEPDYSFSDSEFPDVKPFYEQKYPDGFSGVWKSKKAEIDNGPFMKFLSGFVPGFSGSCPAFGLDFNISTWANFGHVDFMSLCWVFDFIKIIMMVTTLFTCRALIFGG